MENIKYADLQIIIVGGGEKYPKICAKSEKINQNLNRKLIITTGNAENPSKYFDKNSLFVGVSRAALEVMAYGLPIILFGNEGQLGLLDEIKVQFAQKTNFTCRKYGIYRDFGALSDFLFCEICRYYEMSEKEKKSLSLLSRVTVENGYSSTQMAQKILDVYRKALKNHYEQPTKIVLCGYYGHQNLGDETILSVVRQKLREKFVAPRIFVLKNKNPIEIFRALYKADLFIFGGGSLLQNYTSNASLFYYLLVIHASNLLCKRKIMLANGIGPLESGGIITNKFLSKLVARAVNTFDFISVRDSNSQNLLSSALPKRKIHLVPDPALLCVKKNNFNWEKSNEKKRFMYIPCSNGLEKNKISTEILANSLLEIQKKQGIPPLIAVLNPKEDLKIAKELKTILPNAKIVYPKGAFELCELILGTKFVISQRYHGSMFGIVCGTPTLSVSNDPKMYALCNDFECCTYSNTKILSSPNELNCNLSSIGSDFNKNIQQREKIIRRNIAMLEEKFNELF